jgi:hypothetical protein
MFSQHGLHVASTLEVFVGGTEPFGSALADGTIIYANVYYELAGTQVSSTSDDDVLPVSP